MQKAHLERLLHFPRRSQHFANIFREPELLQRLVDVFRRDGLLGFALCDVVRLGGYEGDEFDAAVYEQVSGISRESDAGFGVVGGEDFCDDLLHGCCVEEMVVSEASRGN